LRSSVGITDLNGNGKIDLDEVAKYLYNIDLSGGVAGKKQNIKTYTIGFSTADSPESLLLRKTAQNGGGTYSFVYSSQSFDIAFQNFIAAVLEESVSYVAPVVPISQMERTSAGNQMYLAMFKPTEKSFWKGNIKRYGLATKFRGTSYVDSKGRTVKDGDIIDGNSNLIIDGTIKVGDILDKNGLPAMDSENKIKDTAQSYWSTTVDREYTDSGGVGEILLNRTETRNIYTFLGTNVLLTDSSNAFDPAGNSAITPGLLGLTTTVERDDLVKFIYGYDVYYENEKNPQGPSYKKDWILGAFIHSRPAVVHYANRSVIYAGANDGMLHAFDNTTGQELWAFIPTSLLGKLKDLRGEAIQFFVDGAPKAYTERDSSGNLTKAILIFGLRRGGNSYIALDITDDNSPKFLWEISPTGIKYKTSFSSTLDYKELGQSWSTPILGKIKNSNDPEECKCKWVAFISGGYDETNQDLLNPGNGDSKGKAIYVVDISDGSRIWSYSNSNMNFSIPGDISRVDTNGDGKIDRLYVGDMGGRIWRFDIGDYSEINDSVKWKGKIVFDSNSGESYKRKIFYSPDVSLETEVITVDGKPINNDYEMLFFGTGDREHPKDTTKLNRIYAVKDKGNLLTESNLYDATQDKLQTLTGSELMTEIASLNSKDGWFIKLENSGEKCLSNSVLFYGVIYYTTFQPTFNESDVCSLLEGIARLYALSYKTGNAAFNLDDLGTLADLGKSDRSLEIGTSIPSGLIIAILGDTPVGYVGIPRGVYNPPVPLDKTLIPTSWRIRF
jgi:type IV pilus assembly protein PilY1